MGTFCHDGWWHLITFQLASGFTVAAYLLLGMGDDGRGKKQQMQYYYRRYLYIYITLWYTLWICMHPIELFIVNSSHPGVDRIMSIISINHHSNENIFWLQADFYTHVHRFLLKRNFSVPFASYFFKPDLEIRRTHGHQVMHCRGGPFLLKSSLFVRPLLCCS